VGLLYAIHASTRSCALAYLSLCRRLAVCGSDAGNSGGRLLCGGSLYRQAILPRLLHRAYKLAALTSGAAGFSVALLALYGDAYRGMERRRLRGDVRIRGRRATSAARRQLICRLSGGRLNARRGADDLSRASAQSVAKRLFA